MRYTQCLRTIPPAALAWLVGSSALAAPELPPTPSLSADRNRVEEPSTGFVLLEDDPIPALRTYQGSVAKIMTIHVALWAERNGWVDMNDVVAMSQRATIQGCTCMSDTDGNGLPDTVPGETFRFSDLLDYVAVSAGDATDAVAEHVATGLGFTPSTTNPLQQSEERMRFFVSLMNLHAGLLGLDNSYFPTVHGGDTCDFSIGCFDAIGGTCALGQLCAGGGTTPADLNQLWAGAAAADARFLQILGRRNRPAAMSLNLGNSYPFRQMSFNFYPAIDGQKNGGSGLCQTCYSGVATRLGHTLAATALNGAQSRGDFEKMLTYGFGRLFAPERMGTGAFASYTIPEDIGCHGSDRGVLLERSYNGRIYIRWYDVDVGAKSYQQLAFGTAMSNGSVGAAVAPVSSSRALVFTTNGGYGTLILMGQSGSTVSTLKTATVHNAATLPDITKLSNGLYVTASRRSDGKLQLDTWRLWGLYMWGGSVTWTLSKQSTTVLHEVDELDLAAVPGSTSILSGTGRFAVASKRSSNDALALDIFDVSSSGGLTLVAHEEVGSDRYLVSVSANSDGTFVTMSKEHGLWPTQLDTWYVQGTSTIVRFSRDVMLNNITEAQLAPIGDRGAVAVQRDYGQLRVNVFEETTVPGGFDEGGDRDRHLATSGSAAGDVQMVDICRLESSAADGDYLTMARDLAGRSRVIGWRVAPRPVPRRGG